MILTIECNSTMFSFLLHKHPDKVHSQDTNFGQVHVYYPNHNKVALLLEVDPLKLTRRGGGHPFALKPYVNDRSYVASSLFSVALNQMFRTAMAGRCEKKPKLVDREFRFSVELPSLPARGGLSLVRRLFEPLGYELEAQERALDSRFPEWGSSPYLHLTLRAETTLSRLLRHLYILIPVLDNEKHYWVGHDEVEKLLDKGRDWLEEHPEKELIIRRYLRHQKGLARQAMEQLTPSEEETEEQEALQERKLGLHAQRLEAVAQVLLKAGVMSVVDLGCGEGKLIRRLLKEKQFQNILAMDVSLQALERAESSLERFHESKRNRVRLLHGSLLYDDERLHEQEAACLIEVIEHLEPDRLRRAAHNLFRRVRPQMLVLTTPNREYNEVWESLSAGRFRHSDHRFEWTRQEFQDWAHEVKEDYEVSFSGIGEEHEEFGQPTQMAVFRR